VLIIETLFFEKNKVLLNESESFLLEWVMSWSCSHENYIHIIFYNFQIQTFLISLIAYININMSRRSQQSLHAMIEKSKSKKSDPTNSSTNWEIVVNQFYINLRCWNDLKAWNDGIEENRLPEKLRLHLDIQHELIRRALEKPISEERKIKIMKQMEVLSFMGTPLIDILNIPEHLITF